MQDLNIYIVIRDPKTKQDVNITGNFDVLRAFLSGVGSFEMQSFPAVDPSPITQAPTATRNKRKKIAKETLSPLPA